MKIGVITDIHSNYTALKAVLSYFKTNSCSHVICCGDIIGIGPYPEETVRLVSQIPNLTAVCGNHDRYFTEGIPKSYPNDEHMSHEEAEHHKWEHGLLSHESADFLKSLPYRAEITLDGIKISVVHYCMNSQNKYSAFVPNPSGAELSEMFGIYGGDVVLYGHDHKKHICRSGDVLYANFGSLGCPCADLNIARAGILETENGRVHPVSVETVYNAGEVVDAIERINYPSAEEIKSIFYGVR